MVSADCNIHNTRCQQPVIFTTQGVSRLL